MKCNWLIGRYRFHFLNVISVITYPRALLLYKLIILSSNAIRNSLELETHIIPSIQKKDVNDRNRPKNIYISLCVRHERISHYKVVCNL